MQHMSGDTDVSRASADEAQRPNTPPFAPRPATHAHHHKPSPRTQCLHFFPNEYQTRRGPDQTGFAGYNLCGEMRELLNRT